MPLPVEHVGLVERVATVYRILVSGGGRQVRGLLAKTARLGDQTILVITVSGGDYWGGRDDHYRTTLRSDQSGTGLSCIQQNTV